MLRSHCTPSTTDSTPIMRACSSVGDAKSLSIALLVAARPWVAMQFTEPSLLSGAGRLGEDDFHTAARGQSVQSDSGYVDDTVCHGYERLLKEKCRMLLICIQ